MEVNSRFNNGFHEWKKSPSKMVIPGGEAIPAFHRRVRGSVKRILRKEQAGTILIVTHGGVIASLIADWLRADFDRIILDLKVDNTGLVHAEHYDAGVVIQAINDITHLGKERPNAVAFTQHR
jgi:alpha-ribazole phosphatase